MDQIPARNILKYRSRFNRKNHTQTERTMWYLLRNKRFEGYKFYRQYVIGPYIVDFLCKQIKLIIEVDGAHHEAHLVNYDIQRTKFLEQKGYRVLRLTNDDMIMGLDEIVFRIKVAMGIIKDPFF